jgi:1-phosphatidylinositol-4-phosphate 5-kinase
MRLAWEMTSEFKRPLRNEDFTIEVKFKLPKFQHESTTFVDYAPHAFSNIRKKFNISNDFYMLSLGPEQVLGNLLMGNMSTLSEKVSDGKSGSFFFFSHDSRFLVKTIPTKEAITFSSILPS